MSFFNSRHASQALEALASISGLFTFLTTTEALAGQSPSERPLALLVGLTVALAGLSAFAGRHTMIALRAILAGPFLASVVLAIAVPFSDNAGQSIAVHPAVVSIAFAILALLLFIALRALRDK
jgi:hypothetical protein